MNKYTSAFTLTTFLILAGCDYNVRWVEGNYKVLQIDVKEGSMLCYNVGEGACIEKIRGVVGIGSNSEYISIQACPSDLCGLYFLEKKMDSAHRDGGEVVKGPYSENDFRKIVNELKLPEIKVRGFNS